MFNKELFKSNKILIICSILGIAVISMINSFYREEIPVDYKELSSLSEGSNLIHKLVINEVMSSNDGAFVDENGNLCDWLEIYNGYNYTVNLKNYGLSDTPEGIVKWVFPNVEIPSKGYLIVFLSKKIKGKLHASFSLKKDGNETLTLKRPNGKVVDSVKLVPLSDDVSMARNTKGKWVATDEITPGYENSKNGRESFLSGLQTKNNNSLILTEFLPSNEGNIIFDNNRLYGYVEVMNTSDKTINLKNYYLSNDDKSIYKWRFPDYKLKSGETYLVYTDSLKDDNHTSFSLKHKTGNVILASNKGIVENVSYKDLTNGVAYIKEDKWIQSINISPGYPNTVEGKTKFSEEKDNAPKDIIINELMSSNNQYMPHNGNQFYDWIELYNNSNQAISLMNYYLTTNYDDRKMYALPETVIMPNSYLIVMASGDIGLSTDTYYHTNFKLSSGKGIFLFHEDELVDSSFIYSIPKGYSYGRGNGSGHYYYNNPTPGTINSEIGFRKIVYDPIFLTPGGIYNDISSLTIEFDNSSYAEIYYTLDGSVPTDNSLKYTQPIVLNKTTVVRAVSYLNGMPIGNIVTNSYIINENHTLPVISLSMPQSSFNYVHSNIGSDFTTPAHTDFYEKDSSFSIDCDFKLFGGQSREFAKRSFSINFNDGNLHYKVFDNKDIREFNALVLRSGSQDQNNSMIRDEFATSLVLKYGTLDVQANKPVVLYINGNYWGVYFIREKINASFIRNNHNVGGTTNITNYNNYVEEGSNSDMLKIRNYVGRNDMRNDDNYNYVSSLLDIDNYIDLWVYQYIVNNNDIHNYRYYSNPNVAGGKVRMILFDLDYAMYRNYGTSYFNYIQYPEDSQSFVDTTILNQLMKNYSFRRRFVDRVSYYLKNVWTQEHIEQEINYFYGALNPEMGRNCARWGCNYNSWQYNVQRLKEYAINRIGQIPYEMSSYFSLSQEEVNEYFK